MERYAKLKDISFLSQSDLEKIQNTKILILGAGGIGTNSIVNLASMGIKNFGIVDNDKIEMRNLSIQTLYNENNIGKYKVDIAKEWVNKYNPHLNIKTYNLRLNEENYEEIFKDYEILIDAFDTQKSVHLINKLAVKCNKPIIFSGTNDLDGCVFTTIPHKTPCFNCYIEHQKPFIEKPYGVLQATGAIVSGFQTMEVVKIILNKGNIFHTNPLFIEGFTGRFIFPKISISKTKKCDICGLPLVSFSGPLE